MRHDDLSDPLACAYLERLGVEVAPGEVDAATLGTLVRAHVTRIPFETIDIVRGQPPEIEPPACVERILAGRGGYCYHLNGAFAALLGWLQVDVTRHLAGVQSRGAEPAPGPNGGHLGLTARTPDGREWLVDVGFGDGPAAPLPLTFGRHEQDGFSYELGPSAFDPDGWRLEHHPHGGFVACDFARAPADTTDFLAGHRRASTSPASRFARVATVQRHAAGSVEILRGHEHSTVTPAGIANARVVGEAEWWSLVIDHFALAYDNLTAGERTRVWQLVCARHEKQAACGRA